MSTAPLDRFFRHVQAAGDCWEWTGCRDTRGYGRFAAGSGRTVITHRWLYEQMVADIPAGLQLDHLCRHPWCVNVLGHLEPVPALVNVQRATEHHGSKTHCPAGHRYDAENTRVSNGRRFCRTCIASRVPRADRHGTETNYTYGCRCEPCRDANRAGRTRRRRASQQASAA